MLLCTIKQRKLAEEECMKFLRGGGDVEGLEFKLTIVCVMCV